MSNVNHHRNGDNDRYSAFPQQNKAGRGRSRGRGFSHRRGPPPTDPQNTMLQQQGSHFPGNNFPNQAPPLAFKEQCHSSGMMQYPSPNCEGRITNRYPRGSDTSNENFTIDLWDPNTPPPSLPNAQSTPCQNNQMQNTGQHLYSGSAYNDTTKGVRGQGFGTPLVNLFKEQQTSHQNYDRYCPENSFDNFKQQSHLGNFQQSNRRFAEHDQGNPNVQKPLYGFGKSQNPTFRNSKNPKLRQGFGCPPQQIGTSSNEEMDKRMPYGHEPENWDNSPLKVLSHQESELSHGFKDAATPQYSASSNATADEDLRGRNHNRSGEDNHKRSQSPDRMRCRYHQNVPKNREEDNWNYDEDSRGRKHTRSEAKSHDREQSPDRMGFQKTGQYCRENKDEASGDQDQKQHNNQASYHTPVRNNSKSMDNFRTPDSDVNQYNSNQRLSNDHQGSGVQRGNIRQSDSSFLSSPQSDSSFASPMSETSSPRRKKYRIIGSQKSGKDRNPTVHLSKTLSFILRHGAERKGFQLMSGGFLYVDDLLNMNELEEFSEADVENVVKNNDKQRFALEREDHTGRLKIRANQGHSINVEDLDLKEVTDPKDIPVALHGTYLHCWESIKVEGLKRMNRNHIHFAPGEPGDGVISGMRSTSEVIITINAEKAMADGIKFFQSANKVILSPGDENGCIRPQYFKLAEKLEPERISLELGPTLKCESLASKHPVIPGLPIEENKRKKKKGKRRVKEDERAEGEGIVRIGQGDSLGELETSKDVVIQNKLDENIASSQNMSRNNVNTEAHLENGHEESVTMETSDLKDLCMSDSTSRQTSSRIQYVRIEDEASSVSALEHLGKQKCVVVYCHLDDTEKSITDIVIVTEDFAHHFDLQMASGFDFMNEGHLADFFNTKEPRKIFHGIAVPSAILFHNYSVILDGTDVYDTEVALTHMKDTGQGDFNELTSLGFSQSHLNDKMTKDSDGSFASSIQEHCWPSLCAHDLFDKWFGKEIKKHIFKAVNENIDKETLKQAKKLRNEQVKAKSKETMNEEQQRSGGKSKKNKRKK